MISRLERSNDCSAKYVEITQQLNGFWLRLCAGDIRERYGEGDVELHFAFHLGGCYKVATLRKDDGRSVVNSCDMNRSETLNYSEPRKMRDNTDSAEPSVFLLDIHLVQGEQKGVAIRSSVRLESKDSLLMHHIKPADLLQRVSLGERYFVSDDREINIRGLYGVVGFCQCDRQVIEAAPLALDDGLNGGRKLPKVQFSYFEIVPGQAVGIAIARDCVGICLCEAPEISFQDVYFAIRPI